MGICGLSCECVGRTGALPLLFDAALLMLCCDVAAALAHSSSLSLCNIMCFASEALEVLTEMLELSLDLHIISNK